jgi:hypothetical protein
MLRLPRPKNSRPFDSRSPLACDLPRIDRCPLSTSRNCLTLSDGLVTGYKVAREFESISLQRPVVDVRYSPANCAKQARLAGTFASRSSGETLRRGPKPYFRGFLYDPTFGGGLNLLVDGRGFDLEQRNEAAAILNGARKPGCWSAVKQGRDA